MNTTRSKRWNGKIETLTTDFLNRVLEQMLAYGDRVQFALSGAGLQGPTYQVINTSGKKMAFDGSNHLLRAKADEFVAGNLTAVLTLEQIERLIAGGSIKTASGPARVGRAAGAGTTGRVTAAKVKDLVDNEKYEYFKNNRKTLPPGIGEHSEEISGLMRNGMSAEDAFAEVIKRHF